MKKLLSALVVAALLLIGGRTASADWYTQGMLTTPTGGTVAADTGAHAGGCYLITVVLDANAATLMGLSAPVTFELQRRNAANSANVRSQSYTISSPLAITHPFPTGVCLDTDERVRVIVSGTLAAGSAQASIFVSE